MLDLERMRADPAVASGTFVTTVTDVVGFFSFLALKLVPIYLEHYSIKSVVYSLENEPMISQKSPAEICVIAGR